MRCNETRRRLIEARGEISEDSLGRQVREHLRRCPECAAFVAAEKLLENDLDRRRASRPVDELPFAVVQSRVNARAAARSASRKGHTSQPHYRGTSVMQKIRRNLIRRPRLSISVAAILLVAAAAALLPFKVDDTVGYQVALAGVDPNLALDEGRVQDLLSAVNASGVVYHVDGCDTTCKVSISNIKDPDQLKVVVEAFNEMGNISVDSVLQLTLSGKSTPLNWQEIEDKGGKLTNVEVRKLVVDGISSLSSSGPGQFTIWVNKVDSGSGVNAVPEISQELDDRNVDLTIDASNRIHVRNEQGDEEILDLDDPTTKDRLQELGYNVAGWNQPGQKVFSFCNGDPDGGQANTYVVRIMTDSACLGDTAAEAAKSGNLPEGFELGQNYPNPFNPSTQINYSLPSAQHVTLDIYNIQGQRVKTLVDETRGAGQHTVMWDGTNDAGAHVASGVYLYRLEAGDYVATKKMSLVK